jgi:hypothetical protein
MSLAILLGVSSSASAQKTTVIRVVIVKTDNPAAYAQALEEGKAIMKKAGLPTNIHVYQATYAGPDTNAVAVSIEYPSMVALAEAEAKLRADKATPPGSKASTKSAPSSPTASTANCSSEPAVAQVYVEQRSVVRVL